ncbi:MAG: hypothetical protein ACXABY_12990 [Candidatus Thorarchaeota archaeon]|jgi:hypothetical protein
MTNKESTADPDQYKDFNQTPIQPEFNYNFTMEDIARNFFQDNMISRMDHLIEIFSIFPEKLDKLIAVIEKLGDKLDRRMGMR